MADVVGVHAKSLSVHGLEASGTVHWNLPVESLVELAVAAEREFTAHTKRSRLKPVREQDALLMTNT